MARGVRVSWLALLLAASLVTVSQAQWGGIQTNTINVEITEQKDVQLEIPQGEYRTILINLQTNGANTTLTNFVGNYLYQYQGMSTNWYTITGAVDETAGTLTIPWGPDYDPGKAKYNGWARLLNVSNPVYRLSLDLKMLDTPGWNPSASLLDVTPIDFNTLPYTNAPWTTTTEVGSPLDGRAATNNVNMAGYSITNGVFVGDGSGLTGISGGGGASETSTNYFRNAANLTNEAGNATINSNILKISYTDAATVAGLLSTQVIHTAQIGSNLVDISYLFATQIVQTAGIASTSNTVVTLQTSNDLFNTWIALNSNTVVAL